MKMSIKRKNEPKHLQENLDTDNGREHEHGHGMDTTTDTVTDMDMDMDTDTRQGQRNCKNSRNLATFRSI
jgi:hypothetical protein